MLSSNKHAFVDDISKAFGSCLALQTHVLLAFKCKTYRKRPVERDNINFTARLSRLFVLHSGGRDKFICSSLRDTLTPRDKFSFQELHYLPFLKTTLHTASSNMQTVLREILSLRVTRVELIKYKYKNCVM